MSLLGPSNSWIARGGHVEVVDLGVLDVAHALVVADHQRQERHNHHAAVGDVAVEQVQRVGNPHLLRRLVDQVHQRVHALGELVGGRDLDVGAGGRLGGKVRGGLQVAVGPPWASSCRPPECGGRR
jgi:hypothetical protein